MLSKEMGLASVALPVLLAACSSQNGAQVDASSGMITLAEAELADANGKVIGASKLVEDDGVLKITLDASDLPSSEHGFHLHTTGACDAPDFQSAGGHLNPAGKSHGSMSDNGKHLGDLPNLSVEPDGSAQAEFEIDGDPQTVLSAVFDADGTAVMIHAGPDDYISDPAGDAGPRIACGVLNRL